MEFEKTMSSPSQLLPPRLSSLSLASTIEPSIPDTPSTTGIPSIEIPPHRSHDSNHNLKRSDPFKFGSRYLQPEDDVFEFNAWDHVVPDAAYYAYAETQYTNQRASPVSDFDKKRFNNDPVKWWNRFYSNNTSNFFKDRKWLRQEFPILSELTKKGAGKKSILEVGAGAGNTAFPILKANENEELMVHACDFSKKAVELIRENEAFDEQHLSADVWDVSGEDVPPGVEEGSVDVVLLVFVFSALSPLQWDAAVRNIYKVLKPGGEVCFRDYGKGDLTQVRFKKGRLLETNFYVRGDGTRVYFFEEDELRRIWGGVPALEVLSLGVDRRMLVNRQKQLKMYRCWMQGHFKRPG